MHIPSKHRDCLRQRWRSSVLVVSMLAAVSIGGAARAAAFDETVKAPMMKSAADLRPAVEAFAPRYRAMLEDNPDRLIKDPALARQKFDLRWQLLRAVETGTVNDDLSSFGLVSLGDGSYRIELGEHPEWDDLVQTIAGLLSRENLDLTAPTLIARGFRPEDVSTLKSYVAANDPDAMAVAELTPITLEFGRVVRKYDKLKRSVPDSLIESFYYQRARAMHESKRRWVEGLLKVLDAQRGRILLSAFLEMQPTGIWAPDAVAAGKAELLAEVRKPDFESRVKAEAKARGVAP